MFFILKRMLDIVKTYTLNILGKIKSFFKSAILKIKAVKLPVRIVLASVLAFALVISVLAMCGVRLSYDVLYHGEKIAQISNVAVYRSAKDIAEASVVSEDSEAFNIEDAELRLVLTVNGGQDTAEELSASMLDQTSNAIHGYAVFLNDEAKLYIADKEKYDAEVKAHVDSYNVSGAECVSKLMSEPVLKDVYFDIAILSSDEEVSSFLSSIDVQTTAKKVSEYSVAYKTVTQKTSSKSIGYRAVTTKGVKGVNQKQEVSTYINGNLMENIVDDVVISAPVNEVVVVGIGTSSSKQGFIWPLAVRGTITSYWGDGRNHKGIDIAAPAKTDIYAVKGGTVEFSGWSGNYGNCVLINHGNGIKTRYAHASVLYVKTGETVAQGQVIAGVGTTGQSTGNHLHFEVLINGTRVNPASYIGLK